MANSAVFLYQPDSQVYHVILVLQRKLSDDDVVDKRIMPITMKLSDEDLDLFRKAGEVLYGREHPVPRSTLIRELARRAARQLVKKKKARPGP